MLLKVKRKVAVLGFLYLAAALIASYFRVDIQKAIYLFIGIGLGGFLCYFLDKRYLRVFTCMACVIVIAVLSIAVRYNRFLQVDKLSNTTQEIKGVVVDVSTLDNVYNKVVFYLPKEENGYLPYSTTIEIGTYEYLDVGKSLSTTVLLESVENEDSSFLYNKMLGKNIYLKGVSYAGFKLIPPISLPLNRTLQCWFVSVRESISQKIDMFINPQEAGMFKSLILGDRSDMDYGVNLDFAFANLAHMLAISGLHIGIIATILKSIFDSFTIHKFLSNIMVILITWGFVLLTGAQNSTIRAAIMVTLSLSAYIIGEYSDSITALGLSVVVILAVNPFAAFDMGLTLSVLATLGAILSVQAVASFIERNKIQHKLLRNRFVVMYLNTVAITVGATIALIPFYVLVFKQLSLTVLITNFILTPVLYLILIFGFSFIVVSIPYSVAFLMLYRVLGQIVNSLCEILITSVGFVSKLSAVSISFKNDVAVIWLVFTVIAGFVAFRSKLLKWRVQTVGFVMVYLVCGITLTWWYSYNTVEVITFSSKRAGAIAVVYQNKADIINVKDDSFLEYRITKYLRERGVSKVNRYINLDYDGKQVKVDNQYLIKTLEVKECYLDAKRFNPYQDDSMPINNIIPTKAVDVGQLNGQRFGGAVSYEVDTELSEQGVYGITVNAFDRQVLITPRISSKQTHDLYIMYANYIQEKQRIKSDRVILFDGISVDKTKLNYVYDKKDGVYKTVISKDDITVLEDSYY